MRYDVQTIGRTCMDLFLQQAALPSAEIEVLLEDGS